MRLLSLNICNFGKLQNYRIDFTDNPVIILEENGWGKSTLAAFIRVMFYGFSGENRRSLSEREREKYRPWNKEVYGGSIVYESEGKRYEISKVFGDKEKDDDCVLCDADTRLKILDVDAAHIGLSLFALDERAFMRTVFIAQNDVRVHEDGREDIADGISAKIGNLTDATDDVNRYEIVMNRLSDILNKMSPKRATGSIKQMDAHIGAIVNNLREEQSIRSSVEYLEGRIREEHDKIKKYREERDRLEETFTRNAKLLELVARKEAFTRLWNQYEAAKENLEKMSESYVNGLPKENEINDKLDAWSERNMLINSVSNSKVSLDYLIKARDEEIKRASEEKRLKEEEAARAAKAHEKHRRIGLVLIAASIVAFVLAAAVVFVFNQHIIGVGIGGFGMAMLIAGLIVYPYKKITVETDEDEGVKDIDFSKDTPEIIETRNSINTQNDRIAVLETQVQEFFRFYQFTYLPDNVESSLYDIKQQIMVYNSKVEDVEAKRSEIKEFESDNDMTAIMNLPADEEAAPEIDITDSRAMLEENIRECNENIRHYSGQLEDNLEKLRQMTDFKEEMSSLVETRDRDMHKYEMISLTRDFLKTAKENFSAKYRRPLLEGFKKYYSYLTDEESSEFQIDANIHMTRRELGEARDAESYSVGNRDLYDICLRMALVDAMYKDEKPFVVLDDPFVNLDKRKTERALSFLREVARDYQVIYFTCHESRA